MRGGAGELAFPISSLAMLMLLVPGPHPETHTVCEEIVRAEETEAQRDEVTSPHSWKVTGQKPVIEPRPLRHLASFCP